MNPAPIDVPIVGGSDRLPQDSPQWTRNFYAEKDGAVFTLKPTPGAVLDFELDGTGGGRNEVSVDGRYFAVRGGFFIEETNSGSVTRGTLLSTIDKVGITFNLPPNGQFQILIIDAEHGYVYESAGNVFTILTEADNGFIGGGSQVAYSEGRAVAFKPGTTTFQVSRQYDFLTWEGTATNTCATLNTPILSVVSNADLTYFFSSDGVEIQQDQGTVPLNLRYVKTYRTGILAPNSAAAYEDYTYWLGRTEEGGGIVYKIARTGSPIPISDHTTDRQIATTVTPTDCNSMCYQSLGHKFLVMVFQNGKLCICYDETTQLWHDRAWRDPVSNQMFPPPYINIIQHLGNLLGLDRRNGKVYRVDDQVFTDAGNQIRRDRIMSPIPENADWMTYFQSVELMGQIGNTPVGQADPQLMLRYSVDRGMTWGQEMWEQAGGNSSYAARTKWTVAQAAISFTPWLAIVANQYVSWRNVRIRAQ